MAINFLKLLMLNSTLRNMPLAVCWVGVTQFRAEDADAVGECMVAASSSGFGAALLCGKYNVASL